MITETPTVPEGTMREQIAELYRALAVLRGEVEYELIVHEDRINALEKERKD